MSSKTIYLVDFENVGNAGLSSEGVESNDSLRLFSSDLANAKIDYKALSSFKGDVHKPIETPSADQCVDKTLLAYLGFLIASEEPTTKFVIVSKDKGYAPVVKELKKLKNVSIELRASISGKEVPASAPKAAKKKVVASTKTATAKKTVKKKATKAVKKAAAKKVKTPPPTPNPKNQFKKDIKKALAKAKYSDAQVTQFVSFFCSLLHQTGLSNLQDAKSKLKKKYPAQYEKLFQLVNPAIEKLKKASSQTKTKQKKSGSSTESKAAVPNPPVLNKKSMGKIRDDLNKAIYSKLGSEGFSVPRIGKIASIALAQIAEPNYLQKIWAASQKIDDPDAKKMYELIKPLARETRKKIDQSGSESNQT